VLDPTEPAVIEAGLELTGGRAVVNSVNYEDGDGPDSRMARLSPSSASTASRWSLPTIDERGQARTADRKSVAELLITDLTQLGDARRGHHRRPPDVPHRHRAGGDQADAVETIE
jgi:5-methyltetrahydrofolate--homocysteine methyltransferase